MIGPGDDAAVISAPDGRVVASTDLLVEGRHFRRDWSSAFDIGVKAAAQNLADIAAMGASPTALLVGFAAPGDLAVAWAEDLVRGLVAECARAGAAVAGGDVSSADSVILGITALGDLAGREPVTRTGHGPVTSWPSPGGWAARRPGWPCSRRGWAAGPARSPGCWTATGGRSPRITPDPKRP